MNTHLKLLWDKSAIMKLSQAVSAVFLLSWDLYVMKAIIMHVLRCSFM
jgi:hypothetical protein